MIGKRSNKSSRKLPTAWASSCSRLLMRGGKPLSQTALALLLVPSLSFAPAIAQTAAPAPATPPPACATPDHRAFDFWLGTWDVTSAGQSGPTAVNKITLQHRGCVIREEYSTAGGYTGMSMSFYDSAQRKWHQTWMGMDGTALFIEGGLDDQGQMVLSNANTPYYADGAPINRVTWTPNADGSVRQHWQSSQDGGASWTTVFDGLYVKRSEEPAN